MRHRFYFLLIRRIDLPALASMSSFKVVLAFRRQSIMKRFLGAMALLGLSVGFVTAQTKAEPKPKPAPQQVYTIPTSLKLATAEVYIVLDEGVTIFNPSTLKEKTEKFAAELLLAEDDAGTNGGDFEHIKTRFADYEKAKLELPIVASERHVYDLMLLQTDSCQKFEGIPNFLAKCQESMKTVLRSLTDRYNEVKVTLEKARHPVQVN